MTKEETLCESCAEDESGTHRCRADEAFCIERTACPDYQEYCPCEECGEVE
jgi:hypothetical protein|tara:strand:+ start:1100 stop:1252 length:153 start_codon:yes stop_codon:yes gene_type:complete